METNVRIGLLYCWIFLIVVSCQSDKTSTTIPASMDWLAGHWLSNQNDNSMIEHWKKNNASLYQGTGLFISGTDTLSKESLSLKFIHDTLYYCATVPSQNQGKTIPFKLIHQTDTSFLFTNPNHDFPQSIRYVKHNENNMTVTISTLETINKRSQNFVFVRQ